MDGVIFEDTALSTSNNEIDSKVKLNEETGALKPYNSVLIEMIIEPLKYEIDSEELKSREIKYFHPIADEQFILEYVEGKIALSHEKWSLYAVGDGLLDAEKNLMAEARELSEVFLDIPVSSLDVNALELRDFLLKII